MKISIKLLFKNIVFKFNKNSSVTFALSAVYELIRLRKQRYLFQTTRFTYIFSLVLAFCSCETVVDVNLPEHIPLLVANSFFNPDSVWRVQLFKSKSILDNSPINTVSNASVEILDEEVTIATLNHIGDGNYQAVTNRKPEIGHTYTLKASAPGFEPIEAKDFVPEPVRINSVDVNHTSVPLKLTIHFTDPPQEKNYYQILVLSPWDATSLNSLIPVWIESDDLIFQNLDGINSDDALFDDSLISGQDYSLKIQAYPFQIEPMRPMFAVLVSLTESHYKYIKTLKFQDDNGDNPFSTPIQVYNNIDNGLGIFAGYSVSIFSLF